MTDEAKARLEVLIARNWPALRAQMVDPSRDVVIVHGIRATVFDFETVMRLAVTLGLPLPRQMRMRELHNSLGQWVIVVGNGRPEAFVVKNLERSIGGSHVNA